MLSNIVLVKKVYGKWSMCVDYIEQNNACSKYFYTLPNIYKLVENSTDYKLSFMYAYSDYKQIHIHENDRDKNAFMTKQTNYRYNVVPFGLKNTGATYHWMMNKILEEDINNMLEEHMDGTIVKFNEE